MKNQVSILITGSEVLDGRVHDSNSYWMINALAEVGIGVKHVLSCDDDINAITSCLSFLSAQGGAVIVSGGLGPTTDDLAREALAAFSGQALVESAEARKSLLAFFKARKRECHPANFKQALFPKGASLIANPLGSAPGFVLQTRSEAGKDTYFFTLPGVPLELHKMFLDTVIPFLLEKVFKSSMSVPMLQPKVLRVFGVSESVIGAKVEESCPASGITVSYRAAFPEVQVVFKPNSATLTASELDRSVQAATALIGEPCVFSRSLDLSLEMVVQELLLKANKTVSVAESCTGGLLGGLFANTPGASGCFLGGAITYSNELKIKLLGVKKESLALHGAVSACVAKEMAEGALSRFGSDLALSITGIAGPDGGSEEKPVGTMFIGLATRDGVFAFKAFQAGTRGRIRNYAAHAALDVLRRQLSNLPMLLEVTTA